jgi:cyclic pyranopterin phosphate synthase
MTAREIPLQPLHALASTQVARPRAPAALPLPLATDGPASDQEILDTLGRPLHDLRISVTDRCNFRCSYCMPKTVFGRDYPYLPQTELLTFEEITRVARLFMALGVRKIRLTGGEPLLRRDIETLVGQLAALRTPDGQAADLTLTTNGSLLARKAQALKAAGLRRVTVSLDALDDAIFRRMNDVDFPVDDVLAGIDAAQAAGLGPIKINMVVKRGVNDDQLLPMAHYFKSRGLALRFIEYMDVGATNGWRMDEVLPADEILRRLQTELPLQPLPASAPGETAQRWAYADGSGEIGLIASVTQAFCGDCNRARLSNDGKLYLCLFAHQGHDLRTALRDGASDGQLLSGIAQVWQGRSDRYSALRGQQVGPAGQTHPSGAPGADGASGAGGPPPSRIEMSYIGG